MHSHDSDSLEVELKRNERIKRWVYTAGLLLVSAVLLCAWFFRTSWDSHREISVPLLIAVLIGLVVVIWRARLSIERVETLLALTVSAMPLSRQIWLYHMAATGEEWLRLLGNTYWATSAVIVLVFAIGDRRRGLKSGIAIVLLSILIAVVGVGTGLIQGHMPTSTITYVVGALLFLTLFLVLMSVATIMRDQWHTAISQAAVYSRWALTDKLTGLANRRAGVEVLARECAAANRQDRPLSIIMGDLDNFKLINDSQGHAVGDAVLAGVADRLQATVRQSDLVVRWGGEEFLIIAVDSDRDDARRVAERCRSAIEAEAINGVRMSLTLGVAQYRQGDTEDSLLARADANLYAGKQFGANRVESEDNPVTNFEARTAPE